MAEPVPGAITQTTSQLGIERLYHYQAFDFDRLQQVLWEGKVYFSNPHTFNDPWDCRPFYNLPDIDDDAKREQHVRNIEADARSRAPEGGNDWLDSNLRAMKENPAALRAYLADLSYGMQQIISDSLRLYCLTPDHSNALMWSHYAKNHTGICLEFSCLNPVFGRAQQVIYSKKYPEFDLIPTDPLELILHKSSDWQYENEYRLIAHEGRSNPRVDLYTRRNFFRLDPEMLTGVIMGCMMAPADADRVRQLVNSLVGRSVQLKKMVRAEDRYELIMETLK